MEIRQLRALLAVADTGSVTAAAKTLHVVQPAVTKQIHALESELGVELFERSRSGMSLSASGKLVLERARRALEELDRARAEVLSGTGEDVRGRVSIGLLPSTVGLLAAGLISVVSQRYPGIALRVDVGYAGHLAQWLELGDVDVALLFEQPSTSAFRIRPLLREDLWAVAPSSAGLHADEPVALEELLQHPLVLPAPPHGLRSIVDAASAGVDISVAVETNDAGVQRRLVADGHGWTVLPAAMAIDAAEAVSCAPIVGAALSRTIGTAVARNRAQSTACDLVVELLEEVVATSVASGRWPSARLV
ncbi:LysR substrate-binding domain-containing protein [Gordonia sp. w5E2]|uniref:LysR family transcriptional regulator n=1 Tax=Gordonia jacobaea TaxID=122202 RepID=A0ABR5I9H5_9ACTN|nr:MULTISPECIES: LysR substrate-binding domain-containing protein [Gordonia]KNA90348.1 LysR family transcriptional regulator [Gordonia jacobaea]SKX88123.1 LysR family transcriptional regulator [Mycobacteroides abscessus subsp. abscessus]